MGAAAFQRALRRFETQLTAYEPAVRQAWLRGFTLLRAELPEAALTRLLQVGGLDRLLIDAANPDMIDRAFLQFRSAIRDTSERAATYFVKDLPSVPATAFNFLNPRVVEALRTMDTRVMQGLQTEIRETLREAVNQGLREGLGPRQLASRIKDQLPLSPNQVTAVANFRKALEEGKPAALSYGLRDRQFDKLLGAALGKDGTGLSAAQIRTMTDAYQQRMIQHNAETQARTATLDAMKQGQWQVWKDQLDRGLINSNELWKTWATVGDDRVRPEHIQMNGQTVLAVEPYSNMEMIPGESTYNCRCLSVYRVDPDRAAAQEAARRAPTPEEIFARPSSAYPTIADAAETRERFLSADGTLTPERQELHNAIIRHVLKGLTPVEHPEVMVMGGGPASGKSNILKALGARTNYAHIDVDYIRTLLPEYAEGLKAGLSNIAMITHEESSMLARRLVEIATNAKFNVLVDGTGDSNLMKLTQKVAEYRLHGHRIVANYVTTDTETAVARMIARGKKTGRYVPEDYMRDVHRSISEVLPQAIKNGLFDKITIWDTNGTEAVKIATGVGKRLTILNEPLWQRFLAKKVVGPEWAMAEKVVLGAGALPPAAVTHYVRAYGQEWTADALPSHIPRMPPKNCYENASRLVLQYPELRYVEGIAWPEDGGFPVLHAWAVTPAGKVIDPTWPNPQRARYFGVAYDRDRYLRQITRAGYWGVLGSKDRVAQRVVKTGGKGWR